MGNWVVRLLVDSSSSSSSASQSSDDELSDNDSRARESVPFLPEAQMIIKSTMQQHPYSDDDSESGAESDTTSLKAGGSPSSDDKTEKPAPDPLQQCPSLCQVRHHLHFALGWISLGGRSSIPLRKPALTPRHVLPRLLRFCPSFVFHRPGLD